MTLTPLDQNDPRLRQRCAVLTKVQLRSREQQTEIEALLDYVRGVVPKKAVGQKTDRTRPSTVGLSANQAGIMKAICVVDLSIGRKGYTDLFVLINPRIVWRSAARVMRTEGCVNFPKVWGLTRRATSVKVEAWDRSGNEIVLKLTGWTANLLQHEIDHLEGLLFIDRMPDPEHAHLVEPKEFAVYRKLKPEDWHTYVDMSRQAIVPSGGLNK
jgi:peptide deformylase